MPLPTPILDDRSYQQLRDELVRRIPVYNPEWTDHNPSDPGITLLELFAFLGENVLYRFNQIPETTKLAFLRLLQVPLRPAVPAQGMISVKISSPDPTVDPPRVDQGTEAKAGNLSFETLDEITVAPWRMVAVARTKVNPPDKKLEPEANDFALATLDAIGGLKTGETAAFYKADPLPDDPKKPGALPVDFGKTVDGMIWIAVVGGADDAKEAKFLQRFAEKGLSINVGFVPDQQILATDPMPDPCPGEVGALGRTDPCTPSTVGAGGAVPEVVWEISTGKLDASKNPIYAALTTTGDTTRGLTQEGVVRLKFPRDAAQVGVFVVSDPDARGAGDLPPTLDGLGSDEKVRFWLRAWHRDPSHRFSRVLWIGANASEVLQRKRAVAEFLGTGTGQAGQTYRLKNLPVLENTLVVEVEDPTGGRWVRWTEVAGFEASHEDDRVYTVDLESGEVRFGNGIQGFAPQIGQRIRANEYRFGGGTEGNVTPQAITTLVSPPGASFATLTPQNPLSARGGAPPEAIAAALERIPGELRRHDRAVTASDFRELALATPGADLGRAECLPLFHPKTGFTQAAGVVSVVVWPREDHQHPNAPMPDRTTLREVCAWLDKRRLVTTELYVIPPSYVKVGVAIGVQVKPGYGVDAVRAWVELVVRQYLAPLPHYGPDGNGWPLGKPIYGPEIEAAVLQVEGVEFVEPGQVEVGRLSKDGTTWTEGKVDLARHELPELSAISVVAGPRLPVGQHYAPPPYGKAVPIPTIVEEC